MFKKTNIKGKTAKMSLTNDGVILKIGTVKIQYPLSVNRKEEIEAAIILTSDINRAAKNGYSYFSIAGNTAELVRYKRSLRNYKVNNLYKNDPNKENNLSEEKINKDDIFTSTHVIKKKNEDAPFEKGDDAEQYSDFDKEYQKELELAKERHQEKKKERKRQKEKDEMERE